MPRLCQHLSDKGELKISMWDFLPSTWRQKDVTVDIGQIQQVEKELFCPLPCPTAGRAATGHPTNTANMPHVTFIIRHNCQFYRVPVFIARSAFSGWIVNVCQEAYISLVLPHHSRQVTTRMSPRFNLSVLSLRSLGIPFLCSLISQQEIFSCPGWQTGQGRNINCPCTVYGQILLPLLID